MTTLAVGPNDKTFGGLDTPTAGRVAGSLARVVWGTIERLKTESARTAGAFHDLETLAYEQGTTVEQSTAFTIAKRMLLVLPFDVPSPDLDVDNEGDVLFDWCGTGSRMLTLALREDGRISYATRLSATKSRNGNDLFIDSIPQEIISLVRAVTER